MISFVGIFLEDECKIWLLFTDFHLYEIVVLEEVEFFKGFLEMMDTTEELSKNFKFIQDVIFQK